MLLGLAAVVVVHLGSHGMLSSYARFGSRAPVSFEVDAARRYRMHYGDGAAAAALSTDAGLIEHDADPATAHEDAKQAQQRSEWLATRVAALRSAADQLEADEAAAVDARHKLEEPSLSQREAAATPMMPAGNDAGSMSVAQAHHRLDVAAPTQTGPDPAAPFDLASALAFRLPIVKRHSEPLASVQVAEREWTQSRLDNEDQVAGEDAAYSPKSSLLSAALHVTHSKAECLQTDRFLIMRCPPPSRAEQLPSNRGHHVSPLIEWVRAMALAMSSRRTLLLDTSACGDSDSPVSSVCCNLPLLFKPVSPCVIDFASLRPAARRRALEAMEHWTGSASPLVDAYGPSSIAFFHRSFSCHNGHSLWKSIPGATATQDEGADIVPALSRVHIVRILARFALQPVSQYAAQLSLLPVSLRDQLNVQVSRSGMVPSAWDPELDPLPPFLSVYIPHTLHLRDDVTVGKLQNAHLPRAPSTPPRAFTSGSGVRERNGLHPIDPAVPHLSPQPAPLASKVVSRFYTSSEYVDRIREQAAQDGLKIVVLWTHDHVGDVVSRAGALSANSSSPLVEELRARLPHLMVLDAKAVSAMAMSRAVYGEPLLTLSASAHASLHTLFLLSSGSLMLGSMSNHAVRLVSFLMPSLAFGPVVGGASSGVVQLPLADMDLDAGLYLTCWDSAFHTMRRDTLPGRVRMPPWGSPLGRILYPGVLPASAAALSTGEVTVPVVIGNDEVNIPVQRVINPGSSRRVTLLLMVGFRATGLDQLDSFFNAHAVPLHAPLSRIMSELFAYPQRQAAYLRAKRSFLELLGQEVAARLHDAPQEPLTEAQRQRGNDTSGPFPRAFPGGSHAQRLDHVLPFGHTALLPPPAPVVRLAANLSTVACKSKAMHHMDPSLLVQLLRDFAGSPLSGGAVDIRVVVATRHVKAAALTGLKRIPPLPQPFLKPDWQYLWSIRVLRDQMAALDAELRSLHAGATCVIDFDETIAQPDLIGRKLGAFLGWSHVQLKTPASSLSHGYFAPTIYSFDPFPPRTSTDQYDVSPTMERALTAWFQREGQTLYSEPLPPPPSPERGRAPPLPAATSFTNLENAINSDLFPEWQGRSQAQLDFQSDVHRKTMANEAMVDAERRAVAWMQQLRARNYGSGGSPSNSLLDELLLMARSPSANVWDMLRRLQFPERGLLDVNCADPNLKLMVFSGAFNISEMPLLYTDHTHSTDGIKRMPLLDQCSLSGDYDVSAQVHALARTLSVALLTGRTLVIPHIPNTLSALLDLSALSSCTLESTRMRLNRVPTSQSGCDAIRAGQYFLSRPEAPSADCSDIQPEVSSDPFDSNQRVVAYTAPEYAFQWLLLASEAAHALPRTTLLPTFAEKLPGVQEFVATLTGFILQPSQAMSKHKAQSAHDAWATAGEARPPVADVGILLPLQSAETVMSAHTLASSLLHQLEVWGAFARHATSPPLRLWVSHSCSRNSDLGSNGNSINIGRQRSMEYDTFAEWVQLENHRKRAATAAAAQESSPRRVRRLLEEDSSMLDGAPLSTPPLGTRMHVNVQLQREFIAQYHLQSESRTAPTAGAGPGFRVRWPRRTALAAPHSALSFSSVHERMIADVLADVLMQAETKWSVGAHAHEEGLLVAELRYFAAIRKRLRSLTRQQSAGQDNRFFAGWGVRVSPPIVSPSMHDLYAQSYLTGLMRNEDLHRQTLVYIGQYAALGSAVAGVQPGASPYRMLPPVLLSAPPSVPVVVPKRVLSSHLRFVFVAGIEGVGHHFFDQVLAHARSFNTSDGSSNVKRKLEAWRKAPLQQKNKSVRSIVTMRHNGRVEHPQLRTDAPLSDLFNAVTVHDSAPEFEKAKRQLEARIRMVRGKYDVGGSEVSASASSSSPTVIFLNLLNAGSAGMQSYPNSMGEERSMHHPDLTLLARMFDDAGADLRVMVIVRSAGAAHASTIKRGHGDGIREHTGTDINYMFQSRLLHDNAAIMEADLRALDPRFKLHLQLDRLSRYPVQHAHMISRFTGLHVRSLIHSLLHVSAGFHVKPPSSWHQHSNSDQIAILRDHFAHVATMDFSNGVQYCDGDINGKPRATATEGQGIITALPSDSGQGEQERATVSESRAVSSVLSVATPDALDSIAELRSCVSLSSLRPMLNAADRQSMPMRVLLHSLEGSGEPWLRWLLEQTTAIPTGSVDAYALAPWPASMYVPMTLLKQLPAWSLAGQTSVQSVPTCISCLFEVSWDRRQMTANIQIDRKFASTLANPSVHTPFNSSWTLNPFASSSAAEPLLVAPVGARIVLLRNPLSIVFALATHYLSVHPHLSHENRMLVEGDALDERTRQAVEFARESVVQSALRMVKEEYPKYIADMGLLPEQQRGETVGPGARPTGLFKDTPLGAAASKQPAVAAARAGGCGAPDSSSASVAASCSPTLIVHYEDLESHPVPVLRSVLHFLGLRSRPREWKCVTDMLRDMERGDARPSAINDGRTNSALLQRAASLLPGGPSAARFTPYYPWAGWHVLLPQADYQSFRSDLSAYIRYFEYEPEFDAMEALASPIWTDEQSAIPTAGRGEPAVKTEIKAVPSPTPQPPRPNRPDPPASAASSRMRRSDRPSAPAVRAAQRRSPPADPDAAERLAHLRALGLQADRRSNARAQQPHSALHTQRSAAVDAVAQARERHEQLRAQIPPPVDEVANAREAFLRRHNVHD